MLAIAAPHDISIVEYDLETYPFRAWFEKVLECRELEALHLIRGMTAKNFAEQVFEARTACESRAGELNPVFTRFFDAIVEPRFGAIVSRQQVPTVRTHFAVFEAELDQERDDLQRLGPAAFLHKHYFESYRPGLFHRDKDYGLLPGTVNLWIPVTDVGGANSVWIGGSALRGRDALPVEMKMGQCLFLDGASRRHGAVWNTSPTTRVSFDIRFLPKSAFHQIS